MSPSSFLMFISWHAQQQIKALTKRCSTVQTATNYYFEHSDLITAIPEVPERELIVLQGIHLSER
jgi:hypothetical protein